jgi:hypothetical protein
VRNATALQLIGLLLAVGALSLGVYLFATGRRSIAPIGVIALVIYLVLTMTSRMPLQRMSMPAPFAPEKIGILEPIIRTHLAAVTALTVGLFAWMETAAAFGLMSVYLWTCWIFVAAILAVLFTMVGRVGRESAREEPEEPWNR